MEFMSVPWWSALLSIVLIDLVLAGDNAIVIALAARNLPAHLQKKAIFFGAMGAIVVRSLMTVGVVWLLKVPGLLLVGGLGLLWIAYKLLAEQDSDKEHGEVASTFWGAMRTIVIADALMGVDNVIGVAGAAHGAMDLVIIGLLVSVPIVMFGSSVVLKLVERFPVIVQIGSAVLAYTASKMIVDEPWLASVFGPAAPYGELARWAVFGVAIVGVLAAGAWATRRCRATRNRNEELAALQHAEVEAALVPGVPASTPTAIAALPSAPEVPAFVSPAPSFQKENFMDKIIVYVDDATYALGQLQPMLLTGRRTQWVLVACTPRMTRNAGKWVPQSARDDWRQQWADAAMQTLAPVLESRGDAVQAVVASGPLHALTDRLTREHGPARILDARRPKFGHRLPTVSATQGEKSRSPWQLPLALASVGAMLVLIEE
ncbi:MAG: TerC family protein [Rhodoferax sp.]|nr:TerC family protein [Rhodoferax sp.]